MKMLKSFAFLLVTMLLIVPSVGQSQSGSSEVKRYLIVPLGWQGEPDSGNSLEWVTTTTLHNLSDSLKQVKIGNFDNNGNLAELQYIFGNGETGIGQRAFLQVNAGRTLTFTNSTSRSAMSGVIEFTIPTTNGELDVEIETAYQLSIVDKGGKRTISVTSVGVAEPGKSFRAHVISTAKAETGLAVYNPQDLPVNVDLLLYNTYSGQTYDMYTYKFSVLAKVSFSLGPHQVVSRFVGEIFPNLPADSAGNRVTEGDVQVSASLPVVAAASRVDSDRNRSMYSTVKTISIKPEK